MFHWKPYLCLTLGALGLACFLSLPAGVLSQEKAWVNLLEGNDLGKNWATTGNWILDKEGVVRLEPRPGEKGWTRFDAYLWSKEQFADFEIQFDYKVAASGNSGFYFHVGDLKSPVATGIEVQIYDSASKKPGTKLNDHDSGGIIPGVPPTKNTAKPAGEWNHFHITTQGKKLTVRLNNEVVNEVDLSQGALGKRPATGYIGFQDHGLPLWLRNIKIRGL